jgi:putative transposase
LFGKTRQAWYKYLSAVDEQGLQDAIIITHIKELRKQMPRLGGRKLQHMLTPLLAEHGIDVGRDKLFDLLADNGLLVRRRKRRKVATTDSNHPYRRYPNLVKGLETLSAEQLWVSDITYISLKEDFCYLSLVTDAYSRKIVGYCLYPSLKAEGPLLALDMALQQYSGNGRLIHHSDRGSQYCCHQYTALLQENGIRISMTEKGDPYENAIAERVNGILKAEFQLDNEFDNFEQARKLLTGQ